MAKPACGSAFPEWLGRFPSPLEPTRGVVDHSAHRLTGCRGGSGAPPAWSVGSGSSESRSMPETSQDSNDGCTWLFLLFLGIFALLVFGLDRYLSRGDPVFDVVAIPLADPPSEPAPIVTPNDDSNSVPVESSSVPAPIATLFDDFEDGTQWMVTTTRSTNGAAAREENETEGGNPGGYRRMKHTLPGAADGENAPTEIAVLHLYTGGGWDPSIDGALSHVIFGADRIEFDPPFQGAAIGAVFVIVQDGVTYTAATDENGFSNTTWERAATADRPTSPLPVSTSRPTVAS